MGKSTAIALMKEHGVHPILLGAGRGRGTFWLASAVDTALLEMQRVASTCSFAVNTDAQHPTKCEIKHEEMNIDDLHRLLTYETLHI